MTLTPDEQIRYSRHLLLPEMGSAGQQRLKSARILIVGAGGLGSPAAMYLGAAGVGTIGLVDTDTVDATNLQRQIIYGTPDVGRSKLVAAAARLRELNPHVNVELHEALFASDNARDLVDRYDVIIDGSDNFPTRYLVNDACVMGGKPNIYGSVFRFEGQAAVFAAPGGPCYRCLHPQPPPAGLIPNCAEAGVLGVLPGLIGIVQATEAIKLVAGIGEPLIGRMLLFDALKMRFRDITLPRDPSCPVCGDAPTIRELVEYDQLCEPSASSTEMTVDSYARWRAAGTPHLLIDVRESSEHAVHRIEGSELIPLGDLRHHLPALPTDRPLVVHCKSGGRSARAVALLREHGFDARNLSGGLSAWQKRKA
jgi:sulfur-carrier protein adenylyltransferase/sulfurtransferase